MEGEINFNISMHQLILDNKQDFNNALLDLNGAAILNCEILICNRTDIEVISNVVTQLFQLKLASLSELEALRAHVAVDFFDSFAGLARIQVNLGDHLLCELLHVLAFVLYLFKVNFGTFIRDDYKFFVSPAHPHRHLSELHKDSIVTRSL